VSTDQYIIDGLSDEKNWAKEVKVDQPFCHFEPHVSVVFPKYYDSATKKLADTGQKIDDIRIW
jgi:hypothetical protein